MDVSLQAFAAAVKEKGELLEAITQYDLAFLMEAEDGARGLVILDASLVAGIIEVQVSGRVSSAPHRQRPPTRTDGLVVSEIVDRWLATADSA